MKKCFSLLLAVMLLLSFSFTALAEPDSETEHRTILMEVRYEDGSIVADLVDDQGGTVSSWPVSLIIDGETVATENTDYNGNVVFDYDIPSDTQQVALEASDGGFDIYSFTGCTVNVEDFETEDVPTTDPEEEEYDSTTTTQSETSSTDASDMTTTVPSASQSQSATTPTTSVISAPMTTTLQNNTVAVGVDVDRALLISAQVTADDFASKARLWMDNELYTYHISDSSSSLHLQLTANPQAGDINGIIAAKNASSAFSSFEDSEVKGFAMDMTIVYVDGTNRVPIDFRDGDYTIELPVPLTMRNCKKIAVAVCTDNGLSQLTEVPVSNGIMTFKVQRFQTLAVVGLGDRGVVMGSLSQTPMLVWVLIAVGVVLIIGGILLLVLVSFRRKSGGVTAVNSSADDNDEFVMEAESDDELRRDDLASAESFENVFAEFTDKTPPVKEQNETSSTAPVNDPVAVSAPAVKVIKETKPASNEDFSLNDMLDDVLNDLDDMI